MQRHFDAFAGFGMDAVAVEKFQFFGERREPDFMQTIIFERDVEFALRAENLDGKSVEEFVGEDNERHIADESAANTLASLGWTNECVRPYVSFARLDMLAQGFVQFRSQRGRRFLQSVSERCEKVGELLVRPIEHIAGEEAAAGTEF